MSVAAVVVHLVVMAMRIDCFVCMSSLSAKASLVALADDRQKLPQDISTISEGHLLSGYVASVTKGAVFVRFLGKFTALAPLSQLTDSFVSDPGQHFKVGQSVKALVTSIDEASSRCTVSLKPSLCGSENGQAGLSYFSAVSQVLRLQGLDKVKRLQLPYDYCCCYFDQGFSKCVKVCVCSGAPVFLIDENPRHSSNRDWVSFRSQRLRPDR